MIRPRAAGPLGRGLHVRLPASTTWTSASEETPHHPPARWTPV